MVKDYTVHVCINGSNIETLESNDKEQAERYFNNAYNNAKSEEYPFFIIMKNRNNIIDKIIILNELK